MARMSPFRVTPRQVPFAVTAWSFETAFEPFVSRRLNAVMSNWFSSPSVPRPISSTRAIDTPPVFGRPSPSRMGPATRRTRSASNRSLPAETGVWIVKTLFRATLSKAESRSSSPAATSSRARSASRNAEWPSLRCQAAGAMPERPQRPHATDAQDQLLVKSHLAAADVQDVGDRAIGWVVDRVVRVEEQHRHPPDLDGPDVDLDVAPGKLHGDRERIALAPERPRDREASGVVIGVAVLLVAVRVDRLAEVPVAVQEPDPDERQGHVAGGLHVVAREHPEAAGVDAQRLVEAVLGAEVGDRAIELVGVLAVEPVVRAVLEIAVEVGDHPLGLDHEVGVVEERRPVDHAGEDGDRAVGPGPGRAVDAREEAAGLGVPGPVEVVGETPQSLELGRHADVARRGRGNAHGGLHPREHIGRRGIV